MGLVSVSGGEAAAEGEVLVGLWQLIDYYWVIMSRALYIPWLMMCVRTAYQVVSCEGQRMRKGWVVSKAVEMLRRMTSPVWLMYYE